MEKVLTDKRDLRRAALTRRREMSDEDRRDRSEAIRRTLVGLPEVSAAQTVMTFVSFRAEVETRPLIERWLGEGRRVCVPLTLRERDRIVAVAIENPATDLRPGALGIHEPVDAPDRRVDPCDIDVCVVPGLLFDLRGHRLGYGAGYYDRFLAQLTQSACRTIGVAYAWQVSETDLPVDEWDIRLGAIVTDQGRVVCA